MPHRQSPTGPFSHDAPPPTRSSHPHSRTRGSGTPHHRKAPSSKTNLPPQAARPETMRELQRPSIFVLAGRTRNSRPNQKQRSLAAAAGPGQDHTKTTGEIEGLPRRPGDHAVLRHQGVILLLLIRSTGRQRGDVPVQVSVALLTAEREQIGALGRNDHLNCQGDPANHPDQP